jgi:hypothetical protein
MIPLRVHSDLSPKVQAALFRRLEVLGGVGDLLHLFEQVMLHYIARGLPHFLSILHIRSVQYPGQPSLKARGRFESTSGLSVLRLSSERFSLSAGFYVILCQICFRQGSRDSRQFRKVFLTCRSAI